MTLRRDQHIIEFETPVLESDHDIPPGTDPRLQPFLEQLVAAGLIDRNGTALRSQKLRRGMAGGCWIWRVEFEG